MESKILQIIDNNLSLIDSLSAYEKSCFTSILHCRTEPVPHRYYRCDHCGRSHRIYKSCKNRMCPVCGGADTLKWVAKREAELLPTSYFLLTYTIPTQLRPLFLAKKKLCYDFLFQAMSQTLMKAVADQRCPFQGKAGFFALLHTWDQRLNYHPHLHVVVPAGALSLDKTEWRPSHLAFFLPVRKLSSDFREKLLTFLCKAESSGVLIIPEKIPSLYRLLEELKVNPWVVHSRAPLQGGGNPEYILRYLSRYVNKSAVNEKRIQKVEDGRVHLNYVDRKSKKRKTEIISEEQFLRRLAMHILPKGFKRVRFYGFMANRCRKQMLVICRMLLGTPLSHQHDADESLNDAAFLFWKYFRIDISLCDECGIGHFILTTGAMKGG